MEDSRKKSKLVVTSGWRGTATASVRVASLSSTATRVVMASLTTNNDFGGRNVMFDDSKDMTSDNLNGFSSSGVDDKEQHP